MPLDQVDVEKWEYDEAGKPIEPKEKEMSFLDHLEELRWHIIRSLIAIAVGGVALFIFRDFYFNRVLLGALNDDFAGYQFLCNISGIIGTGDILCFSAPDLKIITMSFAEEFIASIKYAFLGGFVIAFPYVFYEVWSFIKPGLYETEQKATRGVIFVCSLLFFIGVAFGYFIITPFAVNFLGNFHLPNVDNTATLGSFVGYMVMFTLPAAIIFELPVVVHFLSRFGLVTAANMRKYRKHSLVGILVIASLLTPPDVVTQILIAIPLYILYELSIFIARRGEKAYQKSLD